MPDDLRELDRELAALLEPELPPVDEEKLDYAASGGVDTSPKGAYKLYYDEDARELIWGPRPVSDNPLDSHWLKLEMVRRGWWWKITSPFAPGDGGDTWSAGLTPHNITGWNGVPDHHAQAATEAPACALAALQALKGAAK